MMTSIYSHDGQTEYFTKGAPESLLPIATHILDKGVVRVITDNDKKYIEQQTIQFAEKAMRVLAFAYKEEKKIDKNNAESDLVFV